MNYFKLHIVLLILLPFIAPAQHALRFEKEIDELIANEEPIDRRNVILFTGSSSIKLWSDLSSYFPGKNVLNRGFGGSYMEDVVFFFHKIILPYKPQMIIVYEGDNDIYEGKTTDQILEQADSLLLLIRNHLGADVRVAFITAKPSVARWPLKENYIAFNNRLKKWTAVKKKVDYIDIWKPMLNEKDIVRDDIFIQDGLHLNKKGYDIWGDAIKRYIDRYYEKK